MSTIGLDTRRGAGEEILAFCLHSALAVACGFFFATPPFPALVHVLSALSIHRIPDFLTEVFGPIFWLFMIGLGFSVNRYMRHRAAPWIGVIGVVCITIILVWDYISVGHSWYYRNLSGGFWGEEFRQNFTSKCS